MENKEIEGKENSRKNKKSYLKTFSCSHKQIATGEGGRGGGEGTVVKLLSAHKRIKVLITEHTVTTMSRRQSGKEVEGRPIKSIDDPLNQSEPLIS